MEKVNKEKPDLFISGCEGTCWFCNVREPDHTTGHKFHMNKGWGRDNEVITIHAARCQKCKRIHLQQHLFTWIIFIGLCLSFMTIVSSSKGRLNDVLVVSISMLVFKAFWSSYLIVWLSKKMGIRSTLTKDLRKHPEIDQHISTGWYFGEPGI